jgi:hypothetical protein
MLLCDKCDKPIETSDDFLLRHSILGRYHTCSDCSLALERFIESIDRAKERRTKNPPANRR